MSIKVTRRKAKGDAKTIQEVLGRHEWEWLNVVDEETNIILTPHKKPEDKEEAQAVSEGREDVLSKKLKETKEKECEPKTPLGCESGARTRPIQFNWRKHWSKKVATYLNEKWVQVALNLGMLMLDKNWKPGDAPCDFGALGYNKIVKGKLSWYQPLCRCHYIAFFSLAIGIMNYPDLDWRVVTGDVHTVPVGYGPDGKPVVVMDILLFDFFTAEESIGFTQQVVEKLRTSAEIHNRWVWFYEDFLTRFGPRIKARAQELRKKGDSTCS